MDAVSEERFAAIDAAVDRIQASSRRVAESTAESTKRMEIKLALIEQQNERIAEKVSVLGRYVDVTLDVVQEHLDEGHDS